LTVAAGVNRYLSFRELSTGIRIVNLIYDWGVRKREETMVASFAARSLPLVTVLLIGCGQNSFEVETPQSSSDTGSFSSPKVQQSCTFVNRAMMASVLSEVLGFEDGDVPMVDEDGSKLVSSNCKSYKASTGSGSKTCMYLETFSDQLVSRECGSSQFKLALEIFSNACAFALERGDVDGQLFPKGLADLNPLFVAFTGAEADAVEENTLLEMVAREQDASKAKVLVCAAVASSFSANSVN
jgi:hypothetical protein